jgi:hypothetical protein
MRMRAIVMAAMVIVIGASAPAKPRSDRLRAFLQQYVGSVDTDKSTNYAARRIDLRGDGSGQVLVYLSDGGWCGTAGCTMLVLDGQGESFQVITRIPAVRLPISVLPSKSHGWRDILVMERTSAVEPLSTVVLSFDGKKYPEDINRAYSAKGKQRGKVAISNSTKAIALFP